MNIVANPTDGVQVVKVTGDIDLKTSPQFQEFVLPLVSQGKIVIDMTDVNYMSSAGLRAMLATYREVTAKGAQLILVGLNEDLEDTMSMTGFLSFFQVLPTVPEGIAACK